MLRPVPEGPVFRHELADSLRRIGLRAGDTLLVHASMRAIGWVCGGATQVVLALRDVVGDGGTVVAPAQTPDNRDPGRWTHYPAGTVPEEWWDAVREHLPAFDQDLSPSLGMGAIAERLRTWPGARRSAHPQTSFAAVGRLAGTLMAGHELESMLGERSPLARLEECGAKVLLLGVGFDRCTAFHLAEYRQECPPMRENSCVVVKDGRRQWVTYRTVRVSDADFTELGRDFESRTPHVRTGMIGSAFSRLFGVAEAVEFATQWLPLHRQAARDQ